MDSRRLAVFASLAALPVAVAYGCAGAPSTPTASTPAPPAGPTSAAGATQPTTTSDQPVGALTTEAASAAAGDIPDNQVFLVFDDPAGGWSMKYPEGWAQSGSAGDVTFQDKNNLVRVAIRNAPAPTVASVAADIAALRSSQPALRARAPVAVTVKGTPMVKVTYQLPSAPNPVTDKQVTLVVDRYVTAHDGRIAVVDLGTPKGVDNVDAYRLMIESFRWR